MALKAVGAGLALALCSSLLVSCGSSSPAQPGVVPTPAATPTPVPPPSKPLSVIPACALPASTPAALECRKPDSKLGIDVNAAIDRAIAERNDLFDLSNVNGGPRILNVEAYMTAVVSALGEGGVCARIEPEGEIAVKGDNGASEQWIVASRVGWGVPTDHWVQRKYIGTCYPATF
jgi:hypothetical protein